MPASHPPQDYEELIRVIHDRHDQMSKTYQRIAVYLTQNPNEVAVHSVNAIAERCGIHASSFVRFAQSLGYKGFKELQALFQKRLATAAPGFEARVKALETELKGAGDPTEIGFLRDLVVRDIASLQQLLNEVNPTDLALAADLLDRAEIPGRLLTMKLPSPRSRSAESFGSPGRRRRIPPAGWDDAEARSPCQVMEQPKRLIAVTLRSASG